MRLNPQITNPNLIYAGKSLVLPGATTGTGIGVGTGTTKTGTTGAGTVTNALPDYSTVNTIPDANNIINANQPNDAAKSGVSAEPQTRKTIDDYMKEITAAITPKTAAPVAPDYTASLESYRTQYGVADLENQLNDLRAQEADLLAAKETRVAAERGKPVATNVIEGRVSQVEREENERLAAVQRSIANVTNQLQTKYNVIDNLMKTKQMDYQAAVEAYDKEFATSVSMFNAAKNIEDADKTAIEQQQDNARANAQILLNSYSNSGLTYDQLPQTDKTNLTKLGVQAGLGADFFANVLNNSARTNKEILTTIVSDDKTKATIVYKDGTTTTFSTGLPAEVKTPSVTKATENAITSADAQLELDKKIGEGGFVDINDYRNIRREYAAKGIPASTFDSYFSDYLSASDRAKYGIGTAVGFSATGEQNQTATMLKEKNTQRMSELLKKSNNGENLDALTPDELSELYNLL